MSSVNMQNAYNERTTSFYDRMIDESQYLGVTSNPMSCDA